MSRLGNGDAGAEIGEKGVRGVVVEIAKNSQVYIV